MTLFNIVLVGTVTLYDSFQEMHILATAYARYGARFAEGMRTYARSNVVSLLSQSSADVPASSILSAESDLTIGAIAPLGATPTVYSRVSGTTVTLWAVLPVTGSFGTWGDIASEAVQRLGIVGGSVVNGRVMSTAGWNVTLASINIPASPGDVVLRVDYTQGS